MNDWRNWTRYNCEFRMHKVKSRIWNQTKLKERVISLENSAWPSCVHTPLSTKDLMNHLKLRTSIYICFTLCIMLTVILKPVPIVTSSSLRHKVQCHLFPVPRFYWRSIVGKETNTHTKSSPYVCSVRMCLIQFVHILPPAVIIINTGV
jgi:hypothetical protein